LVPTPPLAGPKGAAGTETVSPFATVTGIPTESGDITWVSVAQRAWAVTV
jgi:hypothetical protein